jgi:hypothetical protein
MFEKVRTSLKAIKASKAIKAIKTRQTLKAIKAGHYQRGGAEWYILVDRKADWVTAIAASTTKDLAFITADKRTMEEHFMILERQDELFDIALDIIRTKLGLKPGYTSTDVLALSLDEANWAAKKVELIPYIEDVERLVNFKVDTDTSTGVTKLQSVYDASEPLYSLLVYPKRVNNVFVQTLANLLIVLKANPPLLTQLANPIALKLAASEYKTNSAANIAVLTAMGPRDGFFLNQGHTQFTRNLANGRGFFYEMLDQITTLTEESDLFKTADVGCKHSLVTADWDTIAAHVFHAYKRGLTINDLLALFKDPECKALVQDTEGDALTTIPEVGKHEESVRGTTYGLLIKHMHDPTLQFILHLYYTIKKNEAAVVAE